MAILTVPVSDLYRTTESFGNWRWPNIIVYTPFTLGQAVHLMSVALGVAMLTIHFGWMNIGISWWAGLAVIVKSHNQYLIGTTVAGLNHSKVVSCRVLCISKDYHRIKTKNGKRLHFHEVISTAVIFTCRRSATRINLDSDTDKQSSPLFNDT